tara:strand:+ start:1491 stop:1919 length:429 start_codon:yes stop_codon:yes gene_type:complete
MSRRNHWIIRKEVMPQHTDHAGVLWHGYYLNWLEEARIDALSKVGIKYIDLIKEGYEMPVVSIEIKYKSPILHGEEILIESEFVINESPRIKINSNFIGRNNIITTSSSIDLVLINKENFSIVRKKPKFFLEALNKLKNGPK